MYAHAAAVAAANNGSDSAPHSHSFVAALPAAQLVAVMQTHSSPYRRTHSSSNVIAQLGALDGTECGAIGGALLGTIFYSDVYSVISSFI